MLIEPMLIEPSPPEYLLRNANRREPDVGIDDSPSGIESPAEADQRGEVRHSDAVRGAECGSSDVRERAGHSKSLPSYEPKSTAVINSSQLKLKPNRESAKL